MKRSSIILIAVVIIACVACAVAVYPRKPKERTPAAKGVQERALTPQRKPAITVEVKDRKLLVSGKPAGALPQTEAISVMVADGKVYVNGKRVWAGKTDQFILRLHPEEVRKPAEPREPQISPPELRLRRLKEFIPPAPPAWLTEKEKQEFKRDMQKWRKRFQERVQRQPSEPRERGPGRPLEPPREEEGAERLEGHLEKLLEALERGEEFIRPRAKEFLKRAEKIVDEHIEKLFDRWLEKKLNEKGVMDKAIDRLIERMQKNLREKGFPLPRHEQELKRPPRGSEEDF